MTIDVKRDRCLILGSDGLWNMITADHAARSIQQTETQNDSSLIDSILSLPLDDICDPVVVCNAYLSSYLLLSFSESSDTFFISKIFIYNIYFSRFGMF